MTMIIGRITTYHGEEHPYLRGHEVRIIAVLKKAARSDVADESDFDRITYDETLERAGGVTHLDRVEVQPWIEREGRFSFVTSDPLARDLTCFPEIRGGRADGKPGLSR